MSWHRPNIQALRGSIDKPHERLQRRAERLRLMRDRPLLTAGESSCGKAAYASRGIRRVRCNGCGNWHDGDA